MVTGAPAKLCTAAKRYVGAAALAVGCRFNAVTRLVASNGVCAADANPAAMRVICVAVVPAADTAWIWTCQRETPGPGLVGASRTSAATNTALKHALAAIQASYDTPLRRTTALTTNGEVLAVNELDTAAESQAALAATLV